MATPNALGWTLDRQRQHGFDDHADTDLMTGIASGYVPVWNGTKWVSATPGSLTIALENLTDTSISGRTTGDLLMWNGSAWVNAQTLTGTYTFTHQVTVSTGGLTVTGASTFNDAISITHAGGATSYIGLTLTNSTNAANAGARFILDNGYTGSGASNANDILFRGNGTNYGQLNVLQNGSGGATFVVGVKSNAGSLTDALHILQDGSADFLSHSVTGGAASFTTGHFTSALTVDGAPSTFGNGTGGIVLQLNGVNTEMLWQSGGSNEFSFYYTANSFRLFQYNGAANADRLVVNSSGNFDFKAGTLTTTGAVSMGALTAGLSTLSGVIVNSTTGLQSTANFIKLAANYSSPVGGRVIWGDGTGWTLRFAYGSSSSPTDVFLFSDTGDSWFRGHNFTIGDGISDTNVVQMVIGATYSDSIGGEYSSADYVLSSNAYQTAAITDSWTQSSSGAQSWQIRMPLSAAGALQIRRTGASTSVGNSAAFWATTLMELSANGGLLLDNTTSGSMTVSGWDSWPGTNTPMGRIGGNTNIGNSTANGAYIIGYNPGTAARVPIYLDGAVVMFAAITMALQWPCTASQANSRAWGFIGEQGAFGRFSLYASDADDNTLDTEIMRWTTADVRFFGTTTINSLTYTWPGSQTAAYFLQTDGSGNLSWVSGSPTLSGGTTNRVTKWSSASSITNSLWRDDGSRTGYNTGPVSNIVLPISATATGSGGVAYGIQEGSTLTAGANSDFLIGLRMDTLFSNGAFSSVQAAAAYLHPRKSGGGDTISTLYGLYVADVLDSSTVNYSIYTNRGNVAFFAAGTSPNFGTGSDIIFIGNGTAAPTHDPSGGGYLYALAGALKYRGSSGTITTVGVAEPHCHRCGSDYALEWVNEKWGRLAICVRCLVDTLDRHGVSREEYEIAA